MPTVLQDKIGRMKTLAAEQKSLLDELVAPDVSEFDAETKHARFKTIQEELDKTRPAIDALISADATVKANAEYLAALNAVNRTVPTPAADFTMGRNGAQPATKSVGQLFTESAGYKGLQGMTEPRTDVHLPDIDPRSLKTTFSEAAGFAPPNNRTDIVANYPTRQPMVADLLPTTVTDLQVVKWMLETVFTNNAAAVAESGAIPESAIQYAEQTSTIQKVATFIPVTEEQLADVPSAQDLVNQNLTRMLLLKQETDLLGGSGTPPAITGFYTAVTQAQALGSDPIPDAFYKAMVQCMTNGFANPTGHVIHPLDWQNIRLLRTTLGEYIWGSPALVGPATLWGIPVISTTAATQHTGLTGDFAMYSRLFMRAGLNIKVGLVNDNFIKDLLTLKAELRHTLIITRLTAFCTTTGL